MLWHKLTYHVTTTRICSVSTVCPLCLPSKSSNHFMAMFRNAGAQLCFVVSPNTNSVPPRFARRPPACPEPSGTHRRLLCIELQMLWKLYGMLWLHIISYYFSVPTCSNILLKSRQMRMRMVMQRIFVHDKTTYEEKDEGDDKLWR